MKGKGEPHMSKPATRPVPEGVHTVTPYLIVSSAAKAIDFYREAFGAKEVLRMACPETKAVMHAEVKIGDSLVYVADQIPQQDCMAPEHYKGSPVSLHLTVPDVDASFQRAVNSGCKVVMPVADMFWGDRFGKLKDPFGHTWSVATHKVDYTPEELKANMEKAMKEMGKQQTKSC
jgi:uncharacterized glyoxalase superfamily protein PhnB